MSKNDLQETNVSKEAKENALTINDIRKTIIGDDNKFMLLNVFDNLIQENANLKREIATLDIPENTN
tara:strand:- start:558 stop:758 length:201 start_codon:yes stop_codon:yes gene_type:complete